jgi:hypothetical protein
MTMPTTPTSHEIRKALSKVLSSERMVRSQTRSRLLSYVVEQTLAGNGSRIKAYTIAVEAFGRPVDWDAQADPIVRVEATRLRALLKEYYREEGARDPVIITLPKGGYVPEFNWNEATVAGPEGFALRGSDAVPQFPSVNIRVQDILPSSSSVRPLADALRITLGDAVPRFGFVRHRASSIGTSPEAQSPSSERFTIHLSFPPPRGDDLDFSYSVVEGTGENVIWQGSGSVASSQHVQAAVTHLCGAVLGHSGCIHRYNLARMLSGHVFGEQYRCMLQYLNVVRTYGDPVREAEVRTVLELQLQRDYGFALGYSYLAHLLFRFSLSHPKGWTRDNLMLRAWHLALRGTELTPASGFAQATLYWISDLREEGRIAETAFTAALKLNPYDAEVIMAHGARLICKGHYQAGVDLIEPWLVPEVGYPVQYLFYLAIGKYLLGDVEGLIMYGLRIPADAPSGSQSHPGALLVRTLTAMSQGKRALARSTAVAMQQSLFRCNVSAEEFMGRYLTDPWAVQVIVDVFTKAEQILIES